MNTLLSLISLIILFSCSANNSLQGRWELTIQLQDQELPVIIKLIENQAGEISGELYNSSEIQQLNGKIQGQKFAIDIGVHYAKFVGKISGDKLTGHWIRTNKKNYQIPFSGVRSAKLTLNKESATKQSMINMSGKWKVALDDNKYGLGLFKQTGSRVQGSILTTTGDYRFLDGQIKNNRVKLFGFDGVFSYVIDMVLGGDKFQAKIFSGKSYKSEISGVKDDSFELANANTLTELINAKPLVLQMNSIANKMIDLDGADFKGKAKVIQIFGSWCPNCIDESNFFVKWRKENQAKLNNIKFIAVSFEKTNTREEAVRNLRKVQNKLGMDYDIILADFDKSIAVTDIFPIKKTIAFPTTIFLDKENKVYKVHTGFAGQATGEYFDKFTKEFDESIEYLINL
jgi:thiol-disulfide isomerase/thioredoxin